jgi:hypothetical protein
MLSKSLSESRKSVERSRRYLESVRQEPSPSHSLYTASYDANHVSLTTVLKHLRQEVTSLSLAFSGKEVLVPAAIAQAAKVGTNFDRLAACVLAVPAGTCLQQEWRKGVDGIGEHILKLLDVFIEDLKTSDSDVAAMAKASSSKPGPKPFLVATSAIWSAIDLMLSKSSSSERQALKQVWRYDRECMDDAFAEFKEMLEVDEGVGEDEDLGGDDEWAELERNLAGGTDNMTEEERERVRSVSMTFQKMGTQGSRLTPWRRTTCSTIPRSA